MTYFTHDDYEIVDRQVKCEGRFRLVRYELRHKLFGGGWSQVFGREVMERSSAAAVLPYDPFLDQVVLIEQFRIGALANPASPWLLEIVAGCIEAGKKPPEIAIEEAEQEAGCQIETLHPIIHYFPSPGGCNEFMSLFCGKIYASAVGGIHGLKDENENIRAFALPADEAFTMLRNGEIITSPAIIALQWLQLNREWLRKIWQQ